MNQSLLRIFQFFLIFGILALSNAIAYESINAKSADDLENLSVTTTVINSVKLVEITENTNKIKQIPSLDNFTVIEEVLPDAPEPQPIQEDVEERILFLGNSLTVGMAVHGQGLGEEEIIGKHGYEAVLHYGEDVQFGFICESALELYAFLSYYSKEIEEALPYYDIVMINFGTNSLSTHTDANQYTNHLYP